VNPTATTFREIQRSAATRKTLRNKLAFVSTTMIKRMRNLTRFGAVDSRFPNIISQKKTETVVPSVNIHMNMTRLMMAARAAKSSKRRQAPARL
jgi:hypothetical protein